MNDYNVINQELSSPVVDSGVEGFNLTLRKIANEMSKNCHFFLQNFQTIAIFSPKIAIFFKNFQMTIV